TSSIYSSGEQWDVAGHDFGPSLQSEIPEIKSFIRVHPMYGGGLVSYTNKSGKVVLFRETEIHYFDSTILTAFTFRPIYGQLVGALSKPSTAVLTNKMAQKYFGNGVDPVGQVIQLSGFYPGAFMITAVVEDLPSNSHLSVGFLLSIHTLLGSENYRDNGRLEKFNTYVELYPQAKKELVEEKMIPFVKKYLGDKAPLHQAVIKLLPLVDIHFTNGGSINTVYFLLAVSFFILVIACVNYINLSTARAVDRAREIGVKKALGAYRDQLITQFALESVCINLVAIVIAIVMSLPLLHLLGTILNKELAFDFMSPTIWMWMVMLFTGASVLSGFYPALVLSSVAAKDVIKGQLLASHKGLLLRKVLVIFQFTASLLLIIGTFVMYRQIQFMQSSLKANNDQILIVKGPMAGDEAKNEDRLISFKNQTLNLASVKFVTASEAIPGSGYNWGIHANRKGASENETIQGQNIDVVFVDPDFLKVYNFTLSAGRSWTSGSEGDLRSIIINEACISMFGLGDPDRALTHTMVFDGIHEASIVGVHKNQHWYSLRSNYTPMALWPQKICSAYYSIVITGDIEKTVETVEKLYTAAFPENPFEFYFHDDFFNWQYKADRQFAKIFVLFAALAIAISCLGLLGLASFSVIQRLKEISVRKVLGASVTSIVSMLSGQFLKLILIAAIIAIPLSIYGVISWLESFAFRIEVSWDLFVIPLVALFVISWVSVSLQVVKGANINPAQSLKAE
ncbi:MAG TPA: FtsX-like permease family protein, partial [Chryseolinea sp.]|nr:FtsX-like permease family protein [Chryseolinea sp.]